MLLLPLYRQFQAFENPEDPVNSLWWILLILVFTGFALLVVRLKREAALRWFFLGAIGLTLLYVFYPLADLLVTPEAAFLAAIALSAMLIAALVRYPEWYVVDAAGILMAIGVLAIFGSSLSILPAIVLLAALAIYDAISVYKTKHMIDLADSVVALRLPVLLVIPRRRGYSLLREGRIKEQLARGEEREALFMGLGDVIIPGILAVSAFAFLDAVDVAGIAAEGAVALGTALGGLVGFLVLMRFVLRGNPQAGLPLLNTGAILGFLVAYLAIYRDFGFGL